MQMKPIAAGLASLGRGNDSMLVHMTPGEVAGLQQLALAHGGSLTINPHTGLHEAGFLSSILPTLAGAALTVATEGAIQPWMLGLGVGGITALTSGSLQKGLMAGLGAYGGAGLGGALSSAGLNAVQQEAINEATKAGLAMQMPPEEMALNVAQAKAAAAENFAQRNAFSQMAEGVPTAMSKDFLKENYGKIGAAAAPLAMYGVQQLATPSTLPAGTAAQAGIKPTSYTAYDFTPGRRYNPQTGFFEDQPTFTGGYRTSAFPYAAGGTVPNLSQMYPQSNITRATYATSPQTPVASEVLDGYEPKIDPFTGEQRMAGGGLADLHEYAAGGKLLRGPGDGMSDDIPAVIKGPKPQRAALADGEFVVPADVVSHIGNGSTDAGAKRLYRMMDKVRMARTGRKAQGRQINADKFMPA